MIIIACVDDGDGMMFHCRRQSRDKTLVEDIIEECRGEMLYMNTYSYTLFRDQGDIPVTVRDDFMECAEEGAYCFVENVDVSVCPRKIEAVILYRWNRKYPADAWFTLDLAGGGFELTETAEFRGSSHERITRQTYRRTGQDEIR